MSHYRVAVIHKHDDDDEIATLLAPYSEHLQVEPYLWKSRDEAIAYVRRFFKTNEKTDQECWEMLSAGHITDEDDNIYSTYNPQSMWDYWSDIDSCKVKDLENDEYVREWMPTYAIVTPDGEWYSSGKVGWFATSSNTEEEWKAWVDNYDTFFAQADPEFYVTIVDCHI